MFRDEDGVLNPSWTIALTTMAGVVAIALLIPLACRFQHHIDSAGCAKFTAATGHTVKFIDYTFWSWDCLVQTPNGKWIPLEGLRSTDME